MNCLFIYRLLYNFISELLRELPVSRPMFVLTLLLINYNTNFNIMHIPNSGSRYLRVFQLDTFIYIFGRNP